ncbi:response regulator [Motilimonas sp. 1_MG-2023]|uniref:response regulator n=1 Tax=Motilimonas TaxID=1914248 RepID=UPI0026E20CF6|nr:response regulator [Motilimonas sp. 1_MG-2023]MDO6524273.1 response regulator [Motilimonas sp. 1_MG-2023]
MNKYVLLCVDDEREVLDSVLADLDTLGDLFDIEAAQSVEEARELLTEMQQNQQQLALILCDHMMPGTQGVDFLVELNQDKTHKAAKKLLLTGQAGLEATVEAVNHGGLDFYIAKPWQGDELVAHVQELLTDFILENEPDLMRYARGLDAEKIFSAIHARRQSL